MAEKNAIGQFRNFTNNLTGSQKLVMGGAVAAVLALLIYMISIATAPNMEILFSNLEEQDAGRVVQYLKENDIKYEYDNSGRTIKIEAGKIHDTRIALASSGVTGNSNVGYEIFDETNLGMSEFVQKVNYRRALEGELSRTIDSFDEIKKSRVHIVIPENTLFSEDQKPPTASITVHLKNTRDLNRQSVEGIQSLVANSIEGMQPDNVKITDNRGRLLTEESLDVTSAAGITEAQHNQKKVVEKHLENKVQSMLSGVLGHGNSQVKVNTELDFTRIEQTKKEYDPESQVVRSEQVINEESQSTDSLSFPYVNMAKGQNNAITNYEISENVEHIIKEVGALKKMSVAVMINGKTEVIENNGKKALEYKPRSDEEMDKFEEIIKNAVGYDPSRNDQISVINVPFEHSIDIEDFGTAEPIPWHENPVYRKILLILAGMLLVAILMFTLVRSRFVRDKMKVALALSEGDTGKSGDGVMEELDMDDDDMMFLPSDVPDQMLLDGEKQAKLDGRNLKLELEEAMSGKSPASVAEGVELDKPERELSFEDYESLSEDKVLKLEMKKKVEKFLLNNTQDAVKLMRTLATQGKPPNSLGD